MMLRRFFVPRLHVKQRQIRMHELLVRLQLLRLVPLLDRPRVIPFPIKRHAQRQLRIKMPRLLRQNLLKFRNRPIEFPPAEFEHRLIIYFLQRHSALTKLRIARLFRPRNPARRPIATAPHFDDSKHGAPPGVRWLDTALDGRVDRSLC